MTYVELIVVLSIFAIMTSVTMFNYGKFQAQVDIKVLANDIALKIVQAQKDAMSGKIPMASQYAVISDKPNWKPSYGVAFAPSNKSNFIYFVDLDPAIKYYNDATWCRTELGTYECINNIQITKGNYVSKIEPLGGDGCSTTVGDISILFTRPNSTPIFSSKTSPSCSPDDVVITISSPQGISSKIKIYSSGRIEII